MLKDASTLPSTLPDEDSNFVNSLPSAGLTPTKKLSNRNKLLHTPNGFKIGSKHDKENTLIKSKFRDNFSLGDFPHSIGNFPQISRDSPQITGDFPLSKNVVSTELNSLHHGKGDVDENDNLEKMTAAPAQEVTSPADIATPTECQKALMEGGKQQEPIILSSTTHLIKLPTVNHVTSSILQDSLVSQSVIQEAADSRTINSLVDHISRSSASVIPPEISSDFDSFPSDQDTLSSIDDISLRCAHCPATFSKFSLLQDHSYTLHPDQPIQFGCSRCDEIFCNRSQLDKHLALHSPNCQTCRMCQKTFANVYRLQRHMISHDESTELRKFKCPECSKAFKFKHHLKEHIRIHSGEKPFECNNCGKRFSHSGSYSSHMTSKKCWSVNGKPRERPENDGSVNPTSSCPPGSSPLQYRATPQIDLSQTVSQATSVYPAHLLHINARTMSALPAYYSPTTAAHTAFIPYPLFSTTQTQKHGILAATALYNSKIIRASLSPDVNCNLTPGSMLNVTDESKKIELKIEETIKEVSENIRKEKLEGKIQDGFNNICKFCDESSSNPIELHQHISYKCVKNRASGNKTEKSTTPVKTCKFCQMSFNSPVELHQHERYLCKQNGDVAPKSTDETCRSPTNNVSSSDAILHPEVFNNSAVDNDTDDDHEDTKEESDKKLRMRSLINDEQQRILRAYYDQNPRPRKYELIQIGNRVGFSKRVVQVWFQNMRARDRKRGRSVPYFPSMARYKRPEFPPAKYIPVVPRPFNGLTNQIQSLYAAENVTTPLNLSMSLPKTPQDAPLDLSMKRDIPHAHRGSVIPASPHNSSTEALNLSRKDNERTEPQTHKLTSPKPPPTQQPTTQSPTIHLQPPKDQPPSEPHPKTPSPDDQYSDTSFRDSAIFKYMQREGIFINNTLYPHKTSTPKFAHSPNSAFQQCRDISAKPENTSGDSDFVEARGNLVIDESNGSDMDDSDDEDGLADSGHYSITSCNGTDDQMREEVLRRAKRMRKKSWKRVESDIPDETGTLSPMSEDSPSTKKKRKSWKNHRIDIDEGMYACDQCDKIFSKQSSLARHKYEHSGARPFSCEICYKAFKHKHHLTEHQRLHSGEKPFECKKCGKRFSHSGSFSQHMNHRYKYCKPSLDGSVIDEDGCESPGGSPENYPDSPGQFQAMERKRKNSDSDDGGCSSMKRRSPDIYDFEKTHMNPKTDKHETIRKKLLGSYNDDIDDNNAEIRRRLDAIYSLTNLRNCGEKRKSPFDGFCRTDGIITTKNSVKESSPEDCKSPDSGKSPEIVKCVDSLVSNCVNKSEISNENSTNNGEISTSQKILNAIRNFSINKTADLVSGKPMQNDSEINGDFPVKSMENSDNSSDSCAERSEDRLAIHLQCLNLVRK